MKHKHRIYIAAGLALALVGGVTGASAFAAQSAPTVAAAPAAVPAGAWCDPMTNRPVPPGPLLAFPQLTRLGNGESVSEAELYAGTTQSFRGVTRVGAAINDLVLDIQVTAQLHGGWVTVTGTSPNRIWTFNALNSSAGAGVTVNGISTWDGCYAGNATRIGIVTFRAM